MNIRICPRCRSLDVHRSRRRGAREQMATLWFRRPYRCGACGHRFFASVFAKKLFDTPPVGPIEPPPPSPGAD